MGRDKLDLPPNQYQLDQQYLFPFVLKVPVDFLRSKALVLGFGGRLPRSCDVCEERMGADENCHMGVSKNRVFPSQIMVFHL